MMRKEIRNAMYTFKESGGIVNLHHAVTHITYCVAKNAGDTMLSHCVRKFLCFPQWNILKVNDQINEKTLNHINKTCALVIGGGGLFLPDTNENTISGWQWAVSDAQIDNINVPIIVYSVGYNYFKGQEMTDRFKESVNLLVKRASFVGLRNMGSVRAIRAIVPKELRGKIVFQPCATTLIRKYYQIKKKNKSGIIGLNIPFDREKRRYGKNQERILRQIAKAMLEIEKRGYRIKYIAHCADDLRFLKYLDREHVHYFSEDLTDALPNDIIRCYLDVELMIGGRGHAQMIPFGIGCRIISLGSHDKMKWFLEDIDAMDWYIDLCSPEPEKLAVHILNKFIEVNIQNPARTDKRLREKQDWLWKISCYNRKKIWQIKEKGK